MIDPTAAAILTGGQSRRMGRTKALVEIEGQSMARLVAAALQSGGCSEVALIGGDVDELAGLDLPIIADLHPGEGPVGGVLTAMQHFAERDVLIVACDLPFLTPESIERLLRAFENGIAEVAVAHTDRVEPLCAVWRSTVRPSVQERFDAGTRAVHQMLNGLQVEAVAFDVETLHNVNRPDDLPSA